MTSATINAGALSGFPPEPGGKPAAVLAVLVHVVFFSILVFGLRWSTRAPDTVVVELWNPAPPAEPVVEPAVQPPPPKVEPRPVPKVEPKAEPRPAAVRKPDIAVEKEKKPVAKAEPKLNLDRSKDIHDQLQRELQQVTSEREKAAKVSPPPASAPSSDPGYVNRIRQKIKANIVVPADLAGNPEAIFEVIQLPTGEILQPVRLRKSSGHKGYDDAVERAILKASPLPRPDRPDQFQRQLELRFRPKD